MTMTQRGFHDPDIAMGFRDVLKGIITDIIDKIRPPSLYGVVLQIHRYGPTFNVGPYNDTSDPSGPAPESAGNPYQINYATVRLDNGEIIEARCQEIVPTARTAEWYDPDNPVGTDGGLFIVNDTYRYGNNGTITRPDGTTFTGIVPDMTQFVEAPPFVPPRVEVTGTAGKYVVAGVVRGNAGYEDPFINGAYISREKKVAWTYNLYKVVEAEETFIESGWVGQRAFVSDSGFEITLQWGGKHENYSVHPLSKRDCDAMVANTWLTIEPSFQGTNNLATGLTSDTQANIVRACKLTTGAFVFFVCNQSVDAAYIIDPDVYAWGGRVTVKAIGSDMYDVRDATAVLPAGYDTYSITTNLGGDLPLINGQPYHRPVDVVGVQDWKQQFSMTGGGVIDCDLDAGSQVRVTWSQRFLAMTAKTPYRTAGYIGITMPAVGTVIPYAGQFPTSVTPPSPVTVTADGILVPSWTALYFIAPTGINNSAVDATRFVLVDYRSYIDIPSHWVLVWESNIDSASARLRMGTGREVDVWRTPTLNASFVFNAVPLRYKKEHGIVYPVGAINNASATVATANPITITGLFPAGFRPSNTRLFTQNVYTSSGTVGTAAARVDINNAGTLTIRASVPAGGQFFFDGMNFPAGA